jgi:hypothetical protein
VRRRHGSDVPGIRGTGRRLLCQPHLTVAQTRLCGKEESCAADGHDDNDDHSHSDGAAATGATGPLALRVAALFIAAITIITL